MRGRDLPAAIRGKRILSWSVSAIGKPGPVAAKVAQELSTFRCVDPEEGIKQAAGAAIKAALEAQDSNSAVRVSAGGHQNQQYGSDGKPTSIQNTLSITVEPVYGFVE
jgi:hypothetical protein